MNYLKEIFIALKMLIIFSLLTGIVYPLVVTVLAQVIFNDEAQGSLIVKEGKVIGSRLIGQSFTGQSYFYSRPSVAGVGYDATSSSGSNLGSTNKNLANRVKDLSATLQIDNPSIQIPIDLVTTSASGLDPHITPAAAEFQIPRIAKARQISEEELKKLVVKHTQGHQLGVLGEVRVNVLELNLDLDANYPIKTVVYE